MTRVLIIEDEIDLAELLHEFIQAEGMESFILNDGSDAISWIKKNNPDVIILDIMLPGKNGIQVCKEVREFSDIPIIMATAKIDEIDRLLGFDTGATDYICKPYSSKEVIARIKSLVRLYNRNINNENSDRIVLDSTNHQITYQDKHVELSRTEFNLLSLLHNNPEKIFTRAQIIEEVYDDNRIVTERNVDSHIKNLRKKMAELDTDHEFLHSVYGAGYKFEG